MSPRQPSFQGRGPGSPLPYETSDKPFLSAPPFSSDDHPGHVLRRLLDRAEAEDQRLCQRVDRDQDRTSGRDQRLAGRAAAHLVRINHFSGPCHECWKIVIAQESSSLNF